MYIYADNAGTTKMSPVAIDAMTKCMNEVFGNPSSLHSTGQRAAEVLQKAREDVAEALGADFNEIYFTSGGSEADNQAIRSAALFGAKKGKKHLISTKIEHHAVLHTLKKLEREGFEVTLLDVGADGIVDPADVEKAIREDTALVTIMYANNEIGTLQPIDEIAKICKEKKVTFHTDAVQAVGHVPVNVHAQNIDMLSLSGHKFHGPKGIGFLYVGDRVKIRPIVFGGGQEHFRLDQHQIGGHRDELAGDLHIQPLSLVEISKILLQNGGDADVLYFNFILAQQEQDHVQRAVKVRRKLVPRPHHA